MAILAAIGAWLAANAGSLWAIGAGGVVAYARTWLRQTLVGPIGVALCGLLALAVVVGGYAWHRHSTTTAAVSSAVNEAVKAADNRWKALLAEQRAEAERAQRERDTRAARAAADARKALEDDLDRAKASAADLEAELARITAQQGDPTVFPKDLTRRMRK